MTVLVIGSGGREATAVLSLKKHQVFAAPGNPGMKEDGATCFPDVAADNLEGLMDLVRLILPDVTFVGPEAPLVAGLADRLRAEGFAVVGPSQEAARLEGSKAFAKEFMTRHGITTAAYTICGTLVEARSAIQLLAGPCVVKTNGLAAGKGVTVADSCEEALAAAHEIMVEKKFGQAAEIVIVEERLKGFECSFIVLSDGTNIVPLLPTMDYKRRFDGDQGRNTGGMGCKAPVDLEPEIVNRIMKEIVYPTIEGMSEEGNPFQGFLYCGLMITENGPMVLEYNVRLGDPETCVIVPMLVKPDFGELLLASCRPDGLANMTLEWQDGVAVCVVAVSSGYGVEKKFPTGFPITGIKKAKKTGALVIHAGTAKKVHQLVTAGGRVLDIVGRGADLKEAADKAYDGINCIDFEGIDFRNDIADD